MITIGLTVWLIETKTQADAECRKEKAMAVEQATDIWEQRYVVIYNLFEKEREEKTEEKKREDSLQAKYYQLLHDENLRRFELLKMNVNANNMDQTITITPKKHKP
jgi:hypothetical protein